MTNTRRWPPGPWIEPLRVSDKTQWDFKKDCADCGKFKTIWYFRNEVRVASTHKASQPLCQECGDTAYQMQQMDRMVNG